MKMQSATIAYFVSFHILTIAPLAHGATIISPNSILNSPSEVSSTSGAAIFAIDQGGLSLNFTSGVTDFEAYFSSKPSPTIFSDQEWFTASGVSTASLDLDLGGTVNLERLALW
ncbi:MAG: coagulation factor 5/8 type domain-containing protein, partial [Akkermansiaceae bacterium]